MQSKKSLVARGAEDQWGAMWRDHQWLPFPLLPSLPLPIHFDSFWTSDVWKCSTVRIQRSSHVSPISCLSLFLFAARLFIRFGGLFHPKSIYHHGTSRRTSVQEVLEVGGASKASLVFKSWSIFCSSHFQVPVSLFPLPFVLPYICWWRNHEPFFFLERIATVFHRNSWYVMTNNESKLAVIHLNLYTFSLLV